MVKQLLRAGSQLYVFQPAQALALPLSADGEAFPLTSKEGLKTTSVTPLGKFGHFLSSSLEPVTFEDSGPNDKTLGVIDLQYDTLVVSYQPSSSMASVQLHPPMEKELLLWTNYEGLSASSRIGMGWRRRVLLRVPSDSGSHWANIWSADDLKHALTLEPSRDKRTGWGWDGTEELRGLDSPFARHVDDGTTISVALKGETDTEVVPATVIKPGCKAYMYVP